ncbi:MAG: hypothetical protein ACR2RB_10180 [Gammaproteobacteria bacterium]
MPSLSNDDIKNLFKLLNNELERESVTGEVYLVGGAVMCLVYNARFSTVGVDALFEPAQRIRKAAVKVAKEAGFDEHWLNDAVKGFLSEHGTFDNFIDLSNLKVYVAQPAYLLATKCLAMRIGVEFHDENDVRYLLRFLNIESYDQALSVITQYYPLDRFPQKTLYALAELLPDRDR